MRQKLPKILVTGGAGFIGSEFVRQSIKDHFSIAVIDKLTYASDRKRLADIKNRYSFHQADICQKQAIDRVFARERPQYVVHFAAETHVDRSIQEAAPFLQTNISGTHCLLEASRKYEVKRFIYISTDEVYGEIPRGKFTEASPIMPNSPYSASKAAADHLVKAYIRTYQFPALIVRPSNNYGPWQYPEKFVPVIILKALNNEPVPIYGKGLNVREWLHVSDCACAVLFILKKGKTGEAYNVGSLTEKRNIDIAEHILKLLNKPQSLIQFVQDRPGHDFRYSLNFQKLQQLGWRNQVPFEEGMQQTVRWNQQHIAWLKGKLKFLRSYWKKVYRS